jgi:hypothetical protein
MELSLSRGAASCAANQEFPVILWTPKVYYCVRKSPSLAHIQSQSNPIHTTPPYLSKIHLIRKSPSLVHIQSQSNPIHTTLPSLSKINLITKSPSLVHIQSHSNPIHTTPSYLSKIHLNIIHPPTSWSS